MNRFLHGNTDHNITSEKFLKSFDGDVKTYPRVNILQDRNEEIKFPTGVLK